jgi:hypothetical protein
VRAICGEAPIQRLDDVAQAHERDAGRPSVVAAYRERNAAVLPAEPKLPTMEILHRMRGRVYAGGKSALYELACELRPKLSTPLIRFKGVAGELWGHDFSQVEVHYLDRTHERIRFFVSRLKRSRCVDVQVVGNDGVESLVRSLLAGFERIGGVPLVAVFDNPKTVVISCKDGRIQWNDTFGKAALDCRFAPELCAPARGQEKGSVKSLVGFVKSNFIRPKPADRAVGIVFGVARPRGTTARAYGAKGGAVRTLAVGWQPVGRDALRWDGCDDAGHLVPSGIYFTQIGAEPAAEVRRFVQPRWGRPLIPFSS